MPLFGRTKVKEEPVPATPPPGFGHRSPEQIEAARQIALKARKDRADFMAQVKSRQITLEDILTGSEKDNPVAQHIQVRTLLMALPGAGRASVNKVLNQMAIIEGRRVRGLGKHQRAQLLEWRSQNLPAEGES